MMLSAAWRSALVCPSCRTRIQESNGALECPRCSASFAIRDGVPSFVPVDAYWEDHGFTASGRTFTTPIVGALALRLARRGFLHEIAAHVPAGARVIELGCGGGSRYLAERYDMIGADIAIESAAGAAEVYGSAVHANAVRLPLADGSAAAIISTCFLEHLGDDVVVGALAEMRRVLAPGGAMFHYFDLDADRGFNRWAKRQPWYDHVFVTSRQHDGLRPRVEWLSLLDAAGFRVAHERLLCRTWLQDLSVWAALDDEVVTGMPRRIGRVARAIRQRTDWIADTAVNVIDDAVGWMFPSRAATKAMMRIVPRG